MELFIIIIIFGVMLYELYFGEAVMRLGSGARKISRTTSPFKYWMLLAIQAAFVALALLIWLNIIKL